MSSEFANRTMVPALQFFVSDVSVAVSTSNQRIKRFVGLSQPLDLCDGVEN